jgi:lipid A 4'-phosphatase
MRFRFPSNHFVRGLLFISALVFIYWIFRDGFWDNRVTGWFFNSGNMPNPWTYQTRLWVVVCYKGISILTALLGLSVIGGFAGSFYFEKLKKYRSLCVLMFLLLALGPGLVVNGVLKDHWGRPRPRETVNFGGQASYQAPFVISDKGGKSFPCGHCSVAFAFCGLALWLYDRRKKWAWFILILSILGGLVVGLARVAVGAHYFSDVLVSGFAVFWVAWLLVTLFPKHCLTKENIPASTIQKEGTWQKRIVTMLSLAFALLLLIVSLLAFPFSKQDRMPLVLPETFMSRGDVIVLRMITADDITFDSTPVELEPGAEYVLNVEMTGFGFPWNRAEIRYEVKSGDEFVDLDLSQVKMGFFTELRSSVSLEQSDL